MQFERLWELVWNDDSNDKTNPVKKFTNKIFFKKVDPLFVIHIDIVCFIAERFALEAAIYFRIRRNSKVSCTRLFLLSVPPNLMSPDLSCIYFQIPVTGLHFWAAFMAEFESSFRGSRLNSLSFGVSSSVPVLWFRFPRVKKGDPSVAARARCRLLARSQSIACSLFLLQILLKCSPCEVDFGLRCCCMYCDIVFQAQMIISTTISDRRTQTWQAFSKCTHACFREQNMLQARLLNAFIRRFAQAHERKGLWDFCLQRTFRAKAYEKTLIHK